MYTFEYENEDCSLSFMGEYFDKPCYNGFGYPVNTKLVFSNVRVYWWCERQLDWVTMAPSPAFEAFEAHEERILEHIALWASP